MPKGTKVHRCKTKVMAQGKSVGSAIAICQKSTGQNYATGKPLKRRKTNAVRKVQRKKRR